MSTATSTMTRVIVEAFGGIEQLKVVEAPLPQPGPGLVRVRVTSIGMNHADLMARVGQYRISSGDPPFTPGLEAGGVIDALGEGVTDRRVGQRVVIGPDAPRRAAAGAGASAAAGGGTYTSHYVCLASQTYLAPDVLPDEQLGAIWLGYLTAWGCLVWKHHLKPGQIVAMPAASSNVALAAAQIVKHLGGTAIGLTTSPGKVDTLKQLDTSAFDHIVVTHGPDRQPLPWHKDLKDITEGRGLRGVDVFFDPVAAGAYLETEIRSMAQHGTIYVYGLLGEPGKVDVTPLIRKHGAIAGWAMAELVAAGREAFEPGCRHILEGFAKGTYRQHVDRVFKLADVREAQAYMEEGKHIGKLVLVP
ncbi:MAG: zinc-dependent alcohol dehydrogenase family protein [Phycisphaeraceae bacterium]